MILTTRNAPSDDLRCRIARLLCTHWELLSDIDRIAAINAAYCFGADLAEAALEDGDDEAVGDASDYRRVCVTFGAACGEVNDVEAELWRGVTGDPRQAAFARGFEDHRRGR